MYTKYIKLLDEDILRLQEQLDEKRQLRNHLQQKEMSRNFSVSPSPALAPPPELPFTISPNLRAVNMTGKAQTSPRLDLTSPLHRFPFTESGTIEKPLTPLTPAEPSESALDTLNEEDRRSICVFGIDPLTLKADLHKLFQAYGTIDRITIRQLNRAPTPREPEGGCVAYIQFADPEAVEQALAAKQLYILKGRQLTLSRKRTNLPGFRKSEQQSALLNTLSSLRRNESPQRAHIQDHNRAYWLQ
mmetsp:Transcript_22957/g.35740  ORF Transcript_22957/g.35740 Transcript_22957/m.35740 type:complete len:245 (-) Transcript_22957:139-873(-)